MITTELSNPQYHQKVPDAKYKITDISLEYEIVTQPNLARSIRSEYQSMTCCMTEFSDIDKFQCISQIQCGTGHLGSRTKSPWTKSPGQNPPGQNPP